ncbi:MAG: hypothetical protein ACLR23_05560 [Clostridia bacterium]
MKYEKLQGKHDTRIRNGITGREKSEATVDKYMRHMHASSSPNTQDRRD